MPLPNDLFPDASVIETHISWVFLRDSDVYKVKKPVNLGFLDFRTLEARKVACEAEVILNERLAPGVYVGTVPLRARDGEIVDWAVHMNRLAEDRRADHRLEAGLLDGAAIDDIAVRLSRFHDAARCDETTSRYGSTEIIGKNVVENFVQTREAIGRYLTRSEDDEIEGWQLAFLRDHEELFVKRMKEGRVRDGHGDLRLEHVYLDPLTIIDCIEFNERFRFADVCADIAFLSMDLAWHGRVDLAERLLARYAREANDFDLYALVDFYQSYRAWVRGKVSTMLANERAEAEARKYFDLALASERKWLLEPSVVAVGGLIASGKSTVADRIGLAMSAPVVEADRTRKSMLHLAPIESAASGAWTNAYDRGFTDRVYDELIRRAEVVLASGRSVVLDASFRSRSMRTAARALAKRHDVAFRFVECRATPATCKARLIERAGKSTVSDARIDIFDAFVREVEPMVELDANEHIVIDTERELDQTLSALNDSIATWPLGFVT